MDKKTKYEYGAMSSKYELESSNKLTAYAAMVYHYNRSAHLLVIYSPESCKEDSWMSFTGQISERLDEIFGGEGSFDKYVEEHIPEIKEALQSRKQMV